MKTADGGLAAIAYAPCVVETKIQGKPVKVEVETDYPFRDTIQIDVTVPEPMSFPASSSDPGVDEHDGRRSRARFGGERSHRGGTWPVILDVPEATWSGTKTDLASHLPMPVRLYHGFNDSVAIERGPLVYRPEDRGRVEEGQGQPAVRRLGGLSDNALELRPPDRPRHPERSLTFEEQPIGSPPFSAERSR